MMATQNLTVALKGSFHLNGPYMEHCVPIITLIGDWFPTGLVKCKDELTLKHYNYELEIKNKFRAYWLELDKDYKVSLLLN